MNEHDCNDCVQSRLIEKLTERVDKLEEKDLVQSQKISDLERNTAVNEEQTKMIFKILTEIKESIADINTTIQTLKDKPAKRWEDIVTTIITVTVSIAVTYFITKK